MCTYIIAISVGTFEFSTNEHVRCICQSQRVQLYLWKLNGAIAMVYDY